MDITKDFPQTKPLLVSFSKTELEQFSVITYPAKTIIVKKGSLLKNIYIVLDGVCNMMKDLPNGSTIIVCRLSSFDIIGLGNIFDSTRRAYATTISITELTVLQMTLEEFMYYHHKYSSFSLFLLQNTTNRLHNALQFSNECKTNSTNINILYYLAKSYETYMNSYPKNYTGSVKIDETRQQISDFLGLTIRSLTRYISKYQEQKLITITKGKICMNHQQYKSILALLEQTDFD